MYEVTFYLSAEDYDRLAIAQHRTHRENIGRNQYARELLEQELHILCPILPELPEGKGEEYIL